MVSSTRLYLTFLISKLISFTSLITLIIQVLLTCTKRQYQRQIYLFWLTECISYPCPIIAIVFQLIMAIAPPRHIKSSMNKFFSLFVNTIISPFLIKVNAFRLLRYVISLFCSFLRKIRFESSLGIISCFISQWFYYWQMGWI